MGVFLGPFQSLIAFWYCECVSSWLIINSPSARLNWRDILRGVQAQSAVFVCPVADVEGDPRFRKRTAPAFCARDAKVPVRLTLSRERLGDIGYCGVLDQYEFAKVMLEG